MTSEHALAGDIALVTEPTKKKFTTHQGSARAGYAVPAGFDMLVIDLGHMFEVALAGTGIAHEMTWWELEHHKAHQIDEYTTTRLAFRHRPAFDIPRDYVRVTFSESGLRDSDIYRGGEYEKSNGGIISDPWKLSQMMYDLTTDTELAQDAGYTINGPWTLRSYLDEDGDTTIECVAPTTYEKPKRWRVTPTR